MAPTVQELVDSGMQHLHDAQHRQTTTTGIAASLDAALADIQLARATLTMAAKYLNQEVIEGQPAARNAGLKD